ncbi:MAG: 6-phosphogluconolactonase [Mariprofundaceae bacterium]|nr:6-phosphogluconolactonase [Mariprofundaceae bacterium]
MNIRKYKNTMQMAIAAADYISLIAAQAIGKHGGFHFVLAGGTSPRLCYQQLRQRPEQWAQWHIYFGDERCLPLGDAARNDQMAKLAWLNHVPIPDENIHSMPAEEGAEEGAAAYTSVLASLNCFDCVLLGMGEDGHTASLFPDNPALLDCAAVVPVHNAPKAPPNRVSLSLGRINQSEHRIIMVAGAGKKNAWQAIVDGIPLPASQVDDPLWMYVEK